MRAWALALAAGLAPVSAGAGAWPQAPGSGQIILATTWDHAGRGFDAQGGLTEAVLYDKKEASVFAEYGLTGRLTLVGRAAWQDVTIRHNAGSEEKSGFAATEIGVRALLLRAGRGVVSAQAVVLAPGGVENVSDLSLGEGGWDYEGRLLYGRSFALLDGDGFAEAQAGWRRRTGAPPDEARLDLTLGWSRGDRMAMAQAFGLHAFDARPPRRDYDSLKLQTSVARRIGDETRIQLGAFRTVAGRAIVRETAVFVAVWRSF